MTDLQTICVAILIGILIIGVVTERIVLIVQKIKAQVMIEISQLQCKPIELTKEEKKKITEALQPAIEEIEKKINKRDKN